jgi:hypothetical protein
VVFCSVSLPRFTCCLVGDDGFFHFLSKKSLRLQILTQKILSCKMPYTTRTLTTISRCPEVTLGISVTLSGSSTRV